jgi:hypothetical protein
MSAAPGLKKRHISIEQYPRLGRPAVDPNALKGWHETGIFRVSTGRRP